MTNDNGYMSIQKGQVNLRTDGVKKLRFH